MITEYLNDEDIYEIYVNEKDLCFDCAFFENCDIIMHLQDGNFILPKPLIFNKCIKYTKNCNFE